MFNDTIIAISSPAGESLRGIVRLSGPAAWQLARSISSARDAVGWQNIDMRLPSLHAARLAAFALLFKAPRSFTGEDVAELHLPGSPALLQLTIDALLAAARQYRLPARQAEPGEFSARAFFHGKIDLTQAEGIAATISAAHRQQLRAAATLRGGDLHRAITRCADELASLLASIEAGIDFTDEEDVRFIGDAALLSALTRLENELQCLLAHAVRLDRVDAIPAVVFVGAPNVGKSSLINALAAQERSITSPIAGTTRDMLSVDIATTQGKLRLMDVPGEEPPETPLQQKMMEARHAALMEADLIIEVIAGPSHPAGRRPNLAYGAPACTVQNKADLLPEPFAPDCAAWQVVSAKTGLHIDLLRDQLATLARQKAPISAHLPALNHRHRELLHSATEHIHAGASSTLFQGTRAHPELIAAELRASLDALGQITGTISPDEILGRIFSRFCIGK